MIKNAGTRATPNTIQGFNVLTVMSTYKKPILLAPICNMDEFISDMSFTS